MEDTSQEIMQKILAQHLADITDAEEILQRNVTPVGNSGHVTIPRKHIGKTARIIIRKTKPEKHIELKGYKTKEDSK